MEDIYMQTYKNLSKNNDSAAEKKTLKTLSTALQVDEEDITALLNGNYASSKNCFNAQTDSAKKQACLPKVVITHCKPKGSVSFQEYIDCQKKLQSLYSHTLENEAFAERMGKYSQVNQLFLNGTLEDTDNEKFDIIVDLNILDVILFGDHANMPKNASVFFPDIDFDAKKNSENSTQNENGGTGNNNGGAGNNGNDKTENGGGGNQNPENSGNTAQNTQTSENSNTGEEEIPEDFCIDPDALFFKKSQKPENSGNNNGRDGGSVLTENGNTGTGNGGETIGGEGRISAEDMQNGNYFKPSNDRVGYPDVASIIDQEKAEEKRQDCDDDEQPLFGGRMCIPEFCNDIICVRINIKKGHRKTALRPLDCVECHIDRGNEALTPLLSVRGQSTPNINPMEPNFLSAFANFDGGFFSGLKVELHPKKLPFLIYDKSLVEQKKKISEKNVENSSASPESQNSEKTNDEEKLEKLIEKNIKEYQAISFDCSRGSEGVYRTGTLDDAAIFCDIYNSEIKKDQSRNQREIAQKNTNKSDAYKNVVEPFFYQLSGDMEQINMQLRSIDNSAIQKSGKSCRK